MKGRVRVCERKRESCHRPRRAGRFAAASEDDDEIDCDDLSSGGEID